MARIKVHHPLARVEARVGTAREGIAIAALERRARLAGRPGQRAHTLGHRRVAAREARPQPVVDRSRVGRRLLAPGDHQRRQRLRIERLEAHRGEVHEGQAAVGLGDPILQAGRDPQLLGLDRERERGQPLGGHAHAEQVAAARDAVAITIALEPPKPTPRGIVVLQLTRAHSARWSHSRANRRTVAATSLLAGSADGSAASRASASAAKRSIDTARTAPPYPSDGLPASAARAGARPYAGRLTGTHRAASSPSPAGARRSVGP